MLAYEAVLSKQAKPSIPSLWSSGGVTATIFPVISPYHLYRCHPPPFWLFAVKRLPSLPGKLVNHQEIQALSTIFLSNLAMKGTDTPGQPSMGSFSLEE